MRIRPATEEDVPTLVTAWRAMIEESGLLAPTVQPDWRERLERHFRRGMQKGIQRWLVAEAEDGTIAATGVAFIRSNPAATALTGPTAILAGIYTFPPHRRNGVARSIVQALIDLCRECGCLNVRLRSSAAGRPLYESLGFTPSDEMNLNL